MKQLPELILEWLNSHDHNHWNGLAILSQLTNNRMMIRNLSRKDSKYNREKLFNELSKLSKTFPSITTPTQIDDDDSGSQRLASGRLQPADDNETKDTLPADHPGRNVDDECGGTHGTPTHVFKVDLPFNSVNPDDAKSAEELEISLGKMFNLKGMLSNSLRDFNDGDNEGRKKVIDRMNDIKKSMDQTQSKLDYFKGHGVLPALTDPPPPPPNEPLEKPIPEDPVLLGKRLLNERSNLSKLKKKIAKGSSKPEELAKMEEKLKAKIELVNEIERRLNGSGS